jgi:hypothetical protein
VDKSRCRPDPSQCGHGRKSNLCPGLGAYIRELLPDPKHAS